MSGAGPEDRPFFAEAARAAGPDLPPWKILIVDDEEAIHSVTKLALSSSLFHGRRAQFLDAYTGDEAVSLVRQNPDVALILMDVVMESERAGLDAAGRIRSELGTSLVRLAVRTGQPGLATEEAVVKHFGIDDYREKTELTATRLFTLVHTSLAHYERLRTLELTRDGLRRVLDATASVFQLLTLPSFAEGILAHLSRLLYGRMGSGISGFAAARSPDRPLKLVAGTGRYARAIGAGLAGVGDPLARRRVEQALEHRTGGFDAHHFTAYFRTLNEDDVVLHLSGRAALNPDDLSLAVMFCRNVASALENRHLAFDDPGSEGDLVAALSEAIEVRSRETGNHVRRVAEYARLLAQLYGLDPQTTHLLYLAAPLHDAGKIAIPDAILHKPGPHNETESAIMRTHARLGQQIFESHDSPMLRAAALVAAQHHEHWDGRGYPEGLAGDDIHIFGRIVAIADVFDALTHARCYGQAWPLRRALDYLVEQRGHRFDPALVDLFMQNLDRFVEIHNRLPDAPGTLH